MKKNKVRTLLCSITLLLMIAILVVPATVYASIPEVDIKDSGLQDSITDAGGQIAGIAAAIGAGVAIVMLLWLAIKYMTAAPDEKANIKKTATIYIIGAVLLFAASGVLGLIRGFGEGLFGNGGNGGDIGQKYDEEYAGG